MQIGLHIRYYLWHLQRSPGSGCTSPKVYRIIAGHPNVVVVGDKTTMVLDVDSDHVTWHDMHHISGIASQSTMLAGFACVIWAMACQGCRLRKGIVG